ncbi:hypothetical protein GOAMR_43_00560 [Gordonia amarae NBRC 15530]|uniref:Uncharacterized protein n=1 Tax=Gordonia amarae NBRC 15530 TaxID=1075090 RepID=G7GQ87_9ACTN|nr:hypothetical protein GOAMR_43_00560 [Gordonia amarae NBRC 15530]
MYRVLSLTQQGRTTVQHTSTIRTGKGVDFMAHRPQKAFHATDERFYEQLGITHTIEPLNRRSGELMYFGKDEHDQHSG